MGRQGGGGKRSQSRRPKCNFRSGVGSGRVTDAKANIRTENDLPVSMPLRACSRGEGVERIQVSAGSRTPAAVPGAQHGRGSGAHARVCALGSGPARQHPSPQRRPHGRSASLVLSSALRAARLPGPASRASQARLQQSWLRSGPDDCGDSSGEGGDLAGRRRRWRPRPRRSHLGNQPTPRPSRRKPGGTRGGAAGGSGQ